MRGGGPDAKKIIVNIFHPPAFKPQITWKLWVNPIEKHVNSIYTGKFVVIFFKAPPPHTKVKNFKDPLFVSAPQQVFVNGP